MSTRLTQFGKEVRKLRIDRQMRLAEMAHELEVSSPYLSAVENGKKPVSNKLLEKTIELFDLQGEKAQGLRKAAEVSKKVHTIEVEEGLPNYISTVVAMFVRSIKGAELDKDSAEEIMKILRQGDKNGE